MSSPDPPTFLEFQAELVSGSQAVSFLSGSSSIEKMTRVLPLTSAPGAAEPTGGLAPKNAQFAMRVVSGAEVTSSYARGIPTEEGELRERMRQFEHRTQEQLRRLADAVDALRLAVRNQSPQDGQEESPWTTPIPFGPSELDVGSGRDQILMLLNQIGDGEATCTDGAELQVAGWLADDDPKVRAAAARALSTAYPEKAREVLPLRIAAESNRFVASIMRASLRAAD